MEHEKLVETLQQVGFTQYEAQCYIGLLSQHPLNGSQLSKVSGVPRSMVYQALDRLEERGAVVTLEGEKGEPLLYEPVAPSHVLEQLSSRFHTTCESLAGELDTLTKRRPAQVVVNLIGREEILRRAMQMVRNAKNSLYLLGWPSELLLLKDELQAAQARGVFIRIVSFGALPPLDMQVACFVVDYPYGRSVLGVVADEGKLVLAMMPDNAETTAIWTDNGVLSLLARSFITTQYYIIRMNNERPAVAREIFAAVIEPEDYARFAHVWRFFDQHAAEGKEPEQ